MQYTASVPLCQSSSSPVVLFASLPLRQCSSSPVFLFASIPLRQSSSSPVFLLHLSDFFKVDGFEEVFITLVFLFDVEGLILSYVLPTTCATGTWWCDYPLSMKFLKIVTNLTYTHILVLQSRYDICWAVLAEEYVWYWYVTLLVIDMEYPRGRQQKPLLFIADTIVLRSRYPCIASAYRSERFNDFSLCFLTVLSCVCFYTILNYLSNLKKSYLFLYNFSVYL